MNPRDGVIILRETAGISYGTPKVSCGRRAETGAETINEGPETMTELARESVP